MEKNFNLDADTIINKRFSVDFKGYSPVEVDQFLDIVVKDYEAFSSTVSQLEDKISEYEDTVYELKTKILDLENKLKDQQSSSAAEPQQTIVTNVSQVDILRRIARLEQEVFNRK